MMGLFDKVKGRIKEEIDWQREQAEDAKDLRRMRRTAMREERKRQAVREGKAAARKKGKGFFSAGAKKQRREKMASMGDKMLGTGKGGGSIL